LDDRTARAFFFDDFGNGPKRVECLLFKRRSASRNGGGKDMPHIL
jgi:hypothetical protein